MFSRDLKVLALAFFCIFFGASHQPFMVPYLKEVHGWTNLQGTLVLVAVYGSFMFWRLGIGHSIRRLGDYRSILFGSWTYTLFALMLLLLPHAVILFPFALLWGWGAALLWLTSGAQVLDASQRSRYGAAAGFFYAATNLGFAIGGVVTDVILKRSGDLTTGHRNRLLLTVSVMLLANLVLFAVPRRKVEREASIRTTLRFWAMPELRIAAFLQWAASIGFGIILSPFASYVHESFGSATIGVMVFSYPFIRAVLSLPGGGLSDALGRGRTLLIAFVAGAMGLWIASSWSHPAGAAVAALALGLQGALVPPVSTALVGDTVTSEQRHLALGALFFWRDLGVITAMLGGQFIAQTFGGFQRSFQVFAVLYLLCAWISIWLIREESRPAS